MPKINPTIVILTGELSGDQHIARVIPEIRKRFPGAKIHALGGPALRAEKVDCFAHIEALNIMGLFHVLTRLIPILRLRRHTKRTIHALKPDLTIMVDSPAFNFQCLKTAKRYGHVLYYISPKVWAHGKGRIKTMRQYITHLAVIFPFEVEYFAAHHIPCTYVGNPTLNSTLAHADQTAARKALGLSPNAHIVGLLPGSRPQEIQRLLPVLCESAKRYHALHPETQFVLPLAPSLSEDLLQPYLKDTPITLLKESSISVMQSADFLIIASGTATLEAAHTLTPMTIIYRASALTALWVTHIMTLNHIGLPNILAGKTIVPEILQQDLSPETLISAIDRHQKTGDAWLKQQEALKALSTQSGDHITPLIDVIDQCLAKQ